MFPSRTGEGCERPSMPLWQRSALLALGFFLCAWLGRFISNGGGTVVNYWLPGGLFVAVLLVNPTRDWPWLMLAIVPANALFDLLHDPNPNFAVIAFFCAANIIQSGVGAWLVRKFVAEQPTLATLKEFFGLLLFAGAAGSAVGATLGATMLTTFHLAGSFVATWKILWGGNVMAVLVLSPVILKWFAPRAELSPGKFSAARLLEAGLLFGGLLLFLWCVFAPGYEVNSQKFLALIFMLWAGLRFRVRGAAAAVFFLALISAYLTSQAVKGFSAAAIASGEYAFTLQEFMAVAAMVALVPAIVLEERNRSLARLRESEEKFSKAFQTSPDVMSITDLETGHYLEVNAAHEKIFGYPRAEVLGRSALELGLLSNPALHDVAAAQLKATGSVHNLEIQARNRSGQQLTMLHSAEVITLGGRRCTLRVSHDITEQKQAAQAVRESEEKFSKAFRTSPDVMSIVDLETDCYLEVNDAHEKIFGLTRAQVIGRSPTELGIVAEPTQRKAAVAQLKAAGSLRNREIQARNHRGELLDMLHSADLIELGGRMCILGVSHDITAQKQAVEREQHARIRYTLQLIAAQEAERKRIATELHDSLGQNLSLIKNHAQLALKSGDTSVNAREQLEVINQLAAACIAEARQISHDLHPQQLDHLGLTHALETLVKNTAAACEIQFTAKFDSVDDLFPPDAAMNFYRAVQESLNNILKHAQARRVDIRLERDIHEVQLRIADDGCGFEAGRQTEAKSGLGLKNIAERTRMLGGTFNVDSAPGQGTRLEIKVPAAAEPPETSR